jgi:transcriptional regulator with XRE-family HTH domain
VEKPGKKESQLPAREMAVCERVRAVRLDVKWNQPNFAKALGISRERLASYEYAKAPIRYELAKNICFRFNVNQRWLAEGTNPMHEYFDLSPHLEYLIKPRALFTKAYDEVLKSDIDTRWEYLEDLESGGIGFPRVGTPPREIALFYLNKLIALHLRVMPDDLKGKYYKAISDGAEAFFQYHLSEIEKARASRQKENSVEKGETREAITFASQEWLDNRKPSPQTADMQNVRTYGDLLNRLRKITRPRGAKSELARKFEVSRQAVDQWLSGDSKPSAEIAIQLLHWKPKQSAK